jgi:uncharacterized protein with ATP-grasp and redox domains
MRSTALAAGADEDLVRRSVDEAEKALQSSWQDHISPPVISAPLYNLVGRICGVKDPYQSKKIKYTNAALKLLPDLFMNVKKATDPFETAVRTAIAGNLIDFGTGNDESIIDLDLALKEFLVKPFLISDIEELKASTDVAGTVLYIGDNAGETVFDRPLLSLLSPARITYAARGGPIINDATVDDAILAGIHLHADVISTGDDIPGIVIDRCSIEFLNAWESADLVIAKGQGNFETLTELPPTGKLFMLFSVKCHVAAKYLKADMGDMVAMKW